MSIITALYNCEEYISETINSVLSQNYEKWELLIVDDCSTDNSVEIVKEFIEKDSRIKLYELKRNSGVSVARNKAIEMAKGKYIAFLDSDDLWLPDKLEKQISFMKETNVALTYSAYNVIDEDGHTRGVFIPPPKVTYTDLLKTCSIGCSTAVYDAGKLGKHYLKKVGHEDYALWLKLLKKEKNALGITTVLAKYRLVSGSISGNKLKTAKYQWNIYRKVEKLNFMKSFYYFLHYTYNGFVKHKLHYKG